MPDDLHPTRAALLDAGIRVASRKSLAEISVADIVKEAGVAKGTFYVHFADRSAYLLAQHARFYAQLGAQIQAAIEDAPPGAKRLQLAALAYLDGCLNASAVKAILLDARTLPEVAAQVHHQAATFAGLATRDFKAIGIGNADACARLFIAMVSETALLESESGGADRKLRSALWLLAGISPHK